MNRFTLSLRPHTSKPRAAVRLEVELLEGRNLLSSGLKLGPLVQVTT